MSNQIQATGAVKIRSLTGALTATSGVVTSVPLGGANGVATLDSLGKVPLSQLPASVVTYLGTWNAATNTPTLTNGVGDVGDLYICNVAGTVNFGAGPITFAAGDWVIYSGTTWQKSSGASGTVTSVAATVPTGLTVTGSPITTSGTLAFGLSSGYTIPLSTQLVPTGGTAGQLLAKNSATNYDTTWIDNYANWTEQLRDSVKAAVVITKGQAVYVSGANGTNQLVSLASNTTEATSSKTLGLAMQDLAVNGMGFIITEGLLGGLNTSTATAGDPVWLGTGGNLIYGLVNKPVAPAHLVYIGVVTRSNSSNGEIYIKIQNGFELQELHNVLIVSPANNDGIFYNTSTSLWENKSISTALGYTPANGALYLPLTGGTLTGTLYGTNGNFSSGLSVTGNTSQPLTLANQVVSYSASVGYTTIAANTNGFYFINGGGKGAEFYYAGSTIKSYNLPSSNGTLALLSDLNGYIPTGFLNAVNPLFYSATYGTFSIQVANTSQSGYLTNTDWNTFNSKQSALTNPVTGTGTTNYLTKWTGTNTVNNSLFYDNGTSIGINTTTLTYPINITGTTISLRGQDSGTPRQLTIASGGGTLVQLTAQGFGANYGTDLGLYTATTSGINASPGIYITSSNNIGIGAAPGSYKLDVSGTGRFTSDIYAHTATNGTASIKLGTAATTRLTLSSSDSTGDGLISVTANHDLVLQANSINAVTIKGTGNVGIGTSSPGALLEVQNASNPSIFLTNTGAATLRLQAATGVVYVGSKTADALDFITGDTPRMRITSGGNVCIGTTSGAGILNVSANSTGTYYPMDLTNTATGSSLEKSIRIIRNGSEVGSIRTDATLTYYVTTSDYRLKNDFNNYEALPLINKIKTYDFEWNLDKSRSYGVIAHELQEIFPGAVVGKKDGIEKDGSINPQGVDYSKLVPILVKAIQELNAITKEQNTLITDLTNRLNALETKI